MVDLHMHSSLSDGTDSVKELVDKLIQKNIKYFAITDHGNTLSSKHLKDMQKYLEDNGMKYVNGIELNLDMDGQSMHVLVYDYDIDCPVLNGILDKIHKMRVRRVQRRIDLLQSEFGITLTHEETDWLWDRTNPGKPHLAQILMRRGLVDTIDGGIKKYLYHKFGDDKMDAREVVKELSPTKCLIGIAHPLGGADEKDITEEKFRYNVAELSKYGLDFLECYYSMYDHSQRELIREVAEEHDLLLSGGSDYHGKNKSVILGNLGKDYIPDIQDLTIAKRLFK